MVPPFIDYIVVNWYWILRLIFAMLVCSVLWVLPFVILFSPIYIDDYIKSRRDKNDKN